MKFDRAFELIAHGFRSGRLAHGYIIEALPQGNGREFAGKCLQMIFCVSGQDQPCGTCRNCRQAAAHTYADLIWLEPQKKSRIISVEQIRSIDGRIHMTSFSGGWKACVVNFADRMTDEASNAFLKTLEEPPARTLFLLVTDSPQFLLPTIVSRCQRITLSGDAGQLDDKWRMPIMEILVDAGKNKPAADFTRTDRMLAVCRMIRAAAEEEEEAEMSEAEAGEENDAEVDARISARYLKIRSEVMRFIMAWFRDLYILVSGGEKEAVINADQIDLLCRKASAMNYRMAMDNIAAVEDMVLQFERNMPEGAVFAYGFSRLY